jgi:hypothetical protein
MPTRNVDPNMLLADRLGSGIAQLFLPQSNETRMKYMLGASQIAENDAQVGKLGAETDILTLEHDARNAFTPEDVRLAMAGDTAAQARIGASAARLGTGSQDIATMLSELTGMNMLQHAGGNEERARIGGAIQNGGGAAPLNNPYTQAGIAALFGQETSLNDADNRTEIQKQGIASSAARYGHDRQFEASKYSTDHRLYSQSQGSQLVNGSGGVVSPLLPKPASGSGAGGGAAGEISPTERAVLANEIHKSLGGAYMDPAMLEEAAAFAARRTRETGDAGQALAETRRMIQVAPLEDELEMVGSDGDPIVYTTGATFHPQPQVMPFNMPAGMVPSYNDAGPAKGGDVATLIAQAIAGAQVPQPQQAPAAMPPPEAVAKLKENVHTRFGNGQVWTLRNGQPVQVQ